MNILDYKGDKFNKDTWLEDMYNKQLEVAKKYKDIEKLPQWPLSLDPKSSQVVFKDFIYRCMEELAESYETEVDETTKVYDEDGIELHAIEELADALHFYLELLIYVGIQPIKLRKWYEEYEYHDIPIKDAYVMAYFRAGMCGQQLHNKPWKVDMVRVDTSKFVNCLKELFYAILDVFRSRGATDEIIFDRYTRKNRVNVFRQNSNY